MYQSIDPIPEEINLDQDGNWLATYLISPKKNITVKALGSAQINLEPNLYFPGFILENPQDYLQAQKYWEVDHPEIQKLGIKLKTPQAIYQYVVDNLIYDYGRLSETTTRFGAANTIDNQDSAICMEFTDLFIALARAANIPARAINGYAYTTNSALRPLSLKKDVLHAWPEYYDQEKQLWIPVDPTWGNTTGGVDFFNSTDLNHFAFTMLGLDSQYPVPAGAYKGKDQTTKDINIQFGEALKPVESSSLSFNLPSKVVAGLPINGQIIIKNTGNQALYAQTVSLNPGQFKADQLKWEISVLPPFSSKVIDFELKASSWHSSLTSQLIANSDLSETRHQLVLTPAYQYLMDNTKIKYSLIAVISILFGWLVYVKIKP